MSLTSVYITVSVCVGVEEGEGKGISRTASQFRRVRYTIALTGIYGNHTTV